MNFYKYLFLLCCFLPFASSSQNPFTAGNFVVYRVGDGSGQLGSFASPVFLDEYTPAGVLVQSVPMPTTGNKVNALGQEFFGLPSLSANGKSIIVPGYNMDLNTGSGLGPRSIAVVDFNGTVTSVTTDPNAGFGHMRSVVSDGNGKFWFAAGSGPGIDYTTIGSAAPYNIAALTTTNAVAIVDGQLYASSNNNSFPLVKVGTGLPTTAGQTVTALPGIPIRTRPNQFAFADLDPNTPGMDVLYLTSQNAVSPGGIHKYSLVGGTWTFNGQVGATTESYSGLGILVNGATVTIIATRRGNNSDAIRGGEMVKLVDNSGYAQPLTGTPTVLAAVANPNTMAYRGIALVPQPAPFTPGNIVVYRAGDGVALMNGNASKVFLDEYTTAGSLVQSILLPGLGKKVTMGGNNFFNDGLLTLSGNGRYLVVPGYNATLGTDPYSGAAQRSIGLVDFKGLTTSVTVMPNPDFWPNSGAASNDGSSIWFAGSDGIEYTPVNGTSSTRIIDYGYSSFTNYVYISKGQLYIGHALSGDNRLGKLGNGLPSAPNQVFTEFPGTGSINPLQFELADLDPNLPGNDVLYVASQQNSGGGIKKYSLVSGTWVLNGTVGTTADNYTGLSLKISANVVTIFATRRGGNSTAIRGGELVSLADNTGYNGNLTGTPVVIASVGTANTKSFRGIANVPLGCPGVGTVQALNITPSQVTLSWNAAAGAGNYQYAITTTNTPPATWSNTANTTITVNSLVSGTTYYGHVRSFCDASNVSEWSSVRFVATCQSPALSVTTISSNAMGVTTANWNAVFGSTGYEYAFTTSPAPPATGTGVTTHTATVSNLNPVTQYYLHIRSNCGSGDFSAWITRPYLTGCFSPAVTVVPSLKSAAITWRKVSGARGYEYAITNIPAQPLSGKFTTDTMHLLDKQPEGSNQYLHIRTICGNGSISQWQTIPFGLIGINAYPNPTEGMLHLRWNGAGTANGLITASDMTGRVIKKTGFNGHALDIDTRTWGPGVYIIRYVGGQQTYTLKILKK
ncbi:MAG: T9SS type A sorting domain-containing protein [Chitinophagaceae bacterium]